MGKPSWLSSTFIFLMANCQLVFLSLAKKTMPYVPSPIISPFSNSPINRQLREFMSNIILTYLQFLTSQFISISMSRLLIVIFALIAVASSFNIQQNLKEKCCTSCNLPAVKYISLRNTKCGEACIDPKDYSKIKVFEPTLELATSNTPCADKSYTEYNGTVTHGFGSLKATLDMYLWGGN